MEASQRRADYRGGFAEKFVLRNKVSNKDGWLIAYQKGIPLSTSVLTIRKVRSLRLPILKDTAP
jgi:hypothetical protein